MSRRPPKSASRPRTEVALAALFAGAPMTVLAVLWLRSRIRRELRPLRDLSERLAHYDPMQPGATLGAADREELQPVHAAIDALAGRLTRRVAHERAFTSHAAHALRTPLAGIDAQLAVALREAEAAAPAALAAGAHGGRTAAARRRRAAGHVPQRRRSAAEPDRRRSRWPPGFRSRDDDGARGTTPLDADADLVTAAVLNLIDNAQRHGARSVTFSTPAANVLRVHDDGPGVDPLRCRELRAAIDAQDYAGRTGLGLMLADLVARAHGGGLSLPETRADSRRTEPGIAQRPDAFSTRRALRTSGSRRCDRGDVAINSPNAPTPHPESALPTCSSGAR